MGSITAIFPSLRALNVASPARSVPTPRNTSGMNVVKLKRIGKLFHANGNSMIDPKPVMQKVEGQTPKYRDVLCIKKSPTPQKMKAPKAVRIPKKCMGI
jgi:hypothetical protein